MTMTQSEGVTRWITCGLLAAISGMTVTAADGAGKIRGNAGGIERGAIVFNREGTMLAWTVTGPSGLYEFGGLEPGEYIVLIDGRIAPLVQVRDGGTTVVDQAEQPSLALEMELWTPSRVSFAQSFIATGTAITGFSLWRPAGDSKLTVSLYEDSPAGPRIAGPVDTAKSMNWICGSGLPADQFRTTPGRRYALELKATDGKPWRIASPRLGDVYPDGIAYFDGVPHAESDLGIDIDEASPGLNRIMHAGEDLHFIAEGPGSGFCKVAGQTFIATAPNVIKAYANCGWGGAGVADFIFTIHEDGPGGRQIGPACTSRMVSNWGTDALWFCDAVKLTMGRQYYLQYRRADGEPFFSYLSADVYHEGRAFRDGNMIEERFDQLCGVIGEDEPGSVIYPYDVKVGNITDISATITWRTGTPGDEFVHFGTTKHLNDKTGSESARSTEHRIVLTNLKPGTTYLYRVSSDTHKKSSRRIFSRIYDFLTLPSGADKPRFDRPRELLAPPACADCIAIANPGFENGTTGWTRRARSGRAKNPETYVADAKPFGNATAGRDGYTPRSGTGMYGWSYLAAEDPTWEEPREDWKSEIISQRIAVERGRQYDLTAWLLTGDRGSGWGRDGRIRLAVDESGGGLLDDLDTVDNANATQWFATRHQWRPITLRFRAEADHVTIGVEFLQWWALEASHLYVDELSIRPVK